VRATADPGVEGAPVTERRDDRGCEGDDAGELADEPAAQARERPEAEDDRDDDIGPAHPLLANLRVAAFP
jgi:hypothetical protein